MNTTNLVASPNINGNIGSCETKSIEFQKDFFHTGNIQTNSCTGEIISTNTFITPNVIGGGIFIFILVILFGVLIWNVMQDNL